MTGGVLTFLRAAGTVTSPTRGRPWSIRVNTELDWLAVAPQHPEGLRPW